MKINIFDVVELENNDKATIKEKLGNNKRNKRNRGERNKKDCNCTWIKRYTKNQ